MKEFEKYECPFCNEDVKELAQGQDPYDAMFHCSGCNALMCVDTRDDIHVSQGFAEDDGYDSETMVKVGPVEEFVDSGHPDPLFLLVWPAKKE